MTWEVMEVSLLQRDSLWKAAALDWAECLRAVEGQEVSRG